MKKAIFKIGAVAFCATVMASAFAGCNKNKTDDDQDVIAEMAKIKAEHVTVYTYGNEFKQATPTMDGDYIKLDITSDVNDVEYDIAKFFEENPDYLGKDFYYTRSDSKKDNGSKLKGYAWVETKAGNSNTREYKQLGYHENEEIDGITKSQIAALPDNKGDNRMYILTTGTQEGKHVVYIDPTVESNIEEGETKVDFKFYGDNGEVAIMKTKVVKES